MKSNPKGVSAGGGVTPSVFNGLISADNPYVAVFIGLSGVGKSKTINSIAGKEVCVSRNSPDGVTQEPSIALNEEVLGKKIMLIDAPGLFDPAKKNDEILIQLTELLRKKVDGFDAVVHVIKMGRLTDSELQMPLIILNTLASSPKEKLDLIHRYKIIVTCCDTSDDADYSPANAILEFKGRLLQAFPKELEKSVQNATFVEHNQRLTSEYNDLVKFRQRFVLELVSCRELIATCFKPKLLTDVLNESRTEIEKILREHFNIETLDRMSYDQLIGLQNFFLYVSNTRQWQSVRPTDKLPVEFTQKWSELPMIRRDVIATDIATKLHQQLKEASKRVLERREKELEQAHQRQLEQVRRGQKTETVSGRRCVVM